MLLYHCRIKRTGTTTDIPVSRSQSPSRSITHSIRPASPVQNGIHQCLNKLNLNNLLLLSETLAQEVHQDGVDTTEQVPEVVIKGKSSVNSEVPPKPPTNFGKISGHIIIVYVLSKVWKTHVHLKVTVFKMKPYLQFWQLNLLHVRAHAIGSIF